MGIYLFKYILLLIVIVYMNFVYSSLIIEKNEIKELEKINYDINLKDYNKFKTIKVKQIFLKNLCKKYNLNITGNKTILKQRLFYYFKGSYFSNKIKKIWKMYIFNKLKKARGPAIFNRKMCINTTDFFSMDKLSDISENQFISYKDNDNNIYGFDLLSIYNLIDINKSKSQNPYNRNKIPDNLKNNIKLILKYSRFLKISVDIKINSENNESYKSKIIDLIQFINSLGNYVNYEWFLSLTKSKKISFVRELYDIWFYRAHLSNTVRCEIVPPLGNLFFDINLYNILSLSESILDGYVTKLIERLVKTSNNINNQILGTNYVLCSLTLVNKQAAETYPWLYQSVI